MIPIIGVTYQVQTDKRQHYKSHKKRSFSIFMNCDMSIHSHFVIDCFDKISRRTTDCCSIELFISSLLSISTPFWQRNLYHSGLDALYPHIMPIRCGKMALWGQNGMPDLSSAVVIHVNNDLNESQIGQWYQTRDKTAHTVPYYPKVGANWSDILFFLYIERVHVHILIIVLMIYSYSFIVPRFLPNIIIFGCIFYTFP